MSSFFLTAGIIRYEESNEISTERKTKPTKKLIRKKNGKSTIRNNLRMKKYNSYAVWKTDRMN